MAVRGSVTKRGNKYMARVDLPRGAGGERCQKNRTFRTRREAERWLANTFADGHNGWMVAEKLSVAEYLDQYLAAVTDSIEPTTAATRRCHLAHWRRLLGAVALGKLSPLDVQAQLGNLPPNLVPSTWRQVLASFRTAIRQAVEWGIMRSDPTSEVRLPKVPRSETCVWTAAEARAFLAAARKDRLYALFVLALETGMRMGELLAMRWADVSTAGVTITRSLAWVAGKPYLHDPKTPGSVRRVGLSPDVLPVLRAHRKCQVRERLAAGTGWHDHGLVFCRQNGEPLHPDHVRRRMALLAKAAGLPRIRFHDLRHTPATLLLGAGIQTETVAKRLDHANANMTRQVCAHVTAQMHDEAVRALDGLFGRL